MRYLPIIINRSSNCIRYRAFDVTSSSAAIEVREPPDALSTGRCDCRVALFEALPEMWGADSGSTQVEHTECVADGSPACVFTVSWKERTVSRAGQLLVPGAILLSLAVAAVSSAAGALPASVVTLGLMAGLIILLAGRSRESTLRLETTVRALQEHQRQLTEMATNSEKRYSEMRQAYDELEERTAELGRTREQLDRQQRMAAMGRLLSGVAHELNNPLAGILTSAELLQRLDVDGETGAIAGRIVEGVERCRRLNRNMLDFARQRPAGQEPVDLGEIVHAALDLLAYELRNAEVDVTRQATEQPTVVEGDRGQLQQVVLNLLENAVLSLQDAGAPRRLEIGLARDKDTVVLDIRDNGAGIPEDIRPRVFDPFFTTREVGSAAGLGLSLSHRFVTAHGGTLELLDDAGETGAHFRVSLPSTTLATQVPTDVAEEDKVPSGKGLNPPIPATERPLRLLVIDDEASITQMVCRLLDEYGHETVGASNGKEARQQLAGDRPFDVILLDVKLPGESGPEIFEGLPAGQQDSVIFMTGAMAEENTEDFLFEYLHRTLTKPFTYRELLLIVKQMFPDGQKTPE